MLPQANLNTLLMNIPIPQISVDKKSALSQYHQIGISYSQDEVYNQFSKDLEFNGFDCCRFKSQEVKNSVIQSQDVASYILLRQHKLKRKEAITFAQKGRCKVDITLKKIGPRNLPNSIPLVFDKFQCKGGLIDATLVRYDIKGYPEYFHKIKDEKENEEFNKLTEIYKKEIYDEEEMKKRENEISNYQLYQQKNVSKINENNEKEDFQSQSQISNSTKKISKTKNSQSSLDINQQMTNEQFNQEKTSKKIKNFLKNNQNDLIIENQIPQNLNPKSEIHNQKTGQNQQLIKKTSIKEISDKNDEAKNQINLNENQNQIQSQNKLGKSKSMYNNVEEIRKMGKFEFHKKFLLLNDNLTQERKNYFELDKMKFYNFNDQIQSDEKNILSTLNTFNNPIISLQKKHQIIVRELVPKNDQTIVTPREIQRLIMKNKKTKSMHIKDEEQKLMMLESKNQEEVEFSDSDFSDKKGKIKVVKKQLSIFSEMSDNEEIKDFQLLNSKQKKEKIKEKLHKESNSLQKQFLKVKQIQEFNLPKLQTNKIDDSQLNKLTQMVQNEQNQFLSKLKNIKFTKKNSILNIQSNDTTMRSINMDSNSNFNLNQSQRNSQIFEFNSPREFYIQKFKNSEMQK